MNAIFQSAQFGHALKDYVAGSRWFRAKTKIITQIDVEDALQLPETEYFLLILGIRYSEGEPDRYILPVALVPEGAGEVLAKVDGSAIVNALADHQFHRALLDAVACEQRIDGPNGSVVASRTPAFDRKCGDDPALDSFVSRAEQSNTSIIFRDRYILKLFRKLEEGINPDVEIGNFLTARGFPNTPAVLGNLTYERGSESSAAGILQAFVRNEGDAWKYTLEQLSGFFERALASNQDPPARQSEHPFELAKENVPADVRAHIGPYLESAALLGKRTAEMHVALASDAGQDDFRPEPFTSADASRLHQDLIGQAHIAFDLLRRKQPVLSGPTVEPARELLTSEKQILERFQSIENQPVSAVCIRHHGDYHLGQVLYTGHDFMIIDFEGEPARPLAARREKALALRDVAGMLRSFQYAAFAGLFGQVPGLTVAAESRQRIEKWAAAWNAYVSATYLRAYFNVADGQAFVPADAGERLALLDAFLLQKALYEVAYELNNRPDWLQIPLMGILSLVR
jgi:trehalose synthase-fused probable maltokinase